MYLPKPSKLVYNRFIHDELIEKTVSVMIDKRTNVVCMVFYTATRQQKITESSNKKK